MLSERPILRRSVFLAVPLLLIVGRGAEAVAAGWAGRSPAERTQTAIQTRLSDDRAGDALVCRGAWLCGIHMLPRIYKDRNDLPMWLDPPQRTEKAKALAAVIGRAGEDGLVPLDYHLDVIYDLLARVLKQSAKHDPLPFDPQLWADLDLMLTDAFLLMGSHLAAGRVNPETLHGDWKIKPGLVDLSAILERAVSSGDIEAALARLRPAHRGYTDLREALARLGKLQAAGGWPSVALGETLHPGDRCTAIADLRCRLVASGDAGLPGRFDDLFYFDATLAAAVKRFQRNNGLPADGVVGLETAAMLSVGIEQRIRQVILNLERWRWMPRDLGRRHIIVNTADFRLMAVENGLPVRQMRVVVGRPARRSPVFSADMTYLVLNPYWNVPPTIAAADLLPRLQRDAAYLSRKEIRVFANWRPDAPEIDPLTVNWHAYRADDFPFKLRQEPGPNNALGRLKFMFPNRFAVYLHDTPNHDLFDRRQRDFSSGCIRVEAPLALAEFVLAGDERWSREALASAIEGKTPMTIRLNAPVPVHLVYLTAWVDGAGNLQFRNDLYHRDLELDRALKLHDPHRPPQFAQQQ
jgi:murein L,D-transpeptidase YcbB/YkuD